MTNLLQTKTKEYFIEDEYDTKEILDTIKNMFIKGTLPGVGKTGACKNIENSIFISPYNKLCEQLKKEGYDVITLSRLLGEGVDEIWNSRNMA